MWTAVSTSSKGNHTAFVFSRLAYVTYVVINYSQNVEAIYVSIRQQVSG